MLFLIYFKAIPLRLVGGSFPNEGRIEVFYNGVWGTICDDEWDIEDATVVCRQLGLPTANAQALGGAHFGEGVEPTWLDDVYCLGSESILSDCSHKAWGDEDCGHSEDASVVCNDGEFPQG